jgi:hypothetical protein
VKKESKERKEKNHAVDHESTHQKKIDPNKVVDPKFERLKNIRTNPKSVETTNVETGEVTIYPSIYKAEKTLKHRWDYFINNNGKISKGNLIEVYDK